MTTEWTPHHREDRIAPVMEKEFDRPASLDHPRAPRKPRGIPYFEKYAWLFMRFSGLALIFLVIGHLFIGLMMENGVYRVDFNYVAERWASPFWQIWDMAMLWLAMIHGANGIIDTAYWVHEYTLRQAVQRFGDKLPEKLKKDAETAPDRKVKFCKAVYPRTERDPRSRNYDHC